MESLDEAHRLLPNAKWWIKADGCDVISSLEESVTQDWHGDVDLGDGKCQLLHQEYIEHLGAVTHLTPEILMESRRPIFRQLESLGCDIAKYLSFIHQSKSVCLVVVHVYDSITRLATYNNYAQGFIFPCRPSKG